MPNEVEQKRLTPDEWERWLSWFADDVEPGTIGATAVRSETVADFVDTYPLSPAERALLLLVWRHGAVTAQTAQAECNMTMWELGNTIRRLLAGWFVRREKGGHSKTVIYHITPLGMIAGEAASRGAEVSIVRRIKRRKNAAPMGEMVRMRLEGATVREITDRLGYLNERTVRSHLQRVGLTGKPGRPRKEAG